MGGDAAIVAGGRLYVKRKESYMDASKHLPSNRAPRAATSAHLRPLDSVLQALEETPCAFCQGLLRLIKAHLETTEIPGGMEVLN